MGKKLFGTSGIRGIVNKEFSLNLVSRITRSIPIVLGRKLGIARDGRTSSYLFRNVVVSNLLAAGCEIYDYGTIPTPALQYAIRTHKLNGGIIITASHNPPEYNGLKVIQSNGLEVSEVIENKIEEVYYNNKFILSGWNEIRKIKKIDILEQYQKSVLNHIGKCKINKIVLDLADGVGSVIAPRVFRSIGCEVKTINDEIDGRFPGRGSEPRIDNLQKLSETVLNEGADFGVAYDGDADRAIFIDNNGVPIIGDQSLALLSANQVKNNLDKRAAICITCSNVIKDVVEKEGGEVIWTKVGGKEVSKVMDEKNIQIGGEDSGGIMYAPHIPVKDATMTTALMIDLLSKSQESMSELIKKNPKYYNQKISIMCPNNKKREIIKKALNIQKYQTINTLDGFKMHFTKSSWVLIRPSGTEPKIRLFIESKTKKETTKLAKIFHDFITRETSMLSIEKNV